MTTVMLMDFHYIKVKDTPPDKDINIFNICQLQSLPVTFHNIQKATRSDRVLSKVLTYVERESQKKRILESLHENHPGMSRMKAIARSYFWWSGLDKDIAKFCSACQAIKPTPAAAPLHPWVWPDAPWKRVHVDFAGPFLGKMFFILVDTHSKWPEVVMMSSTTSLRTIEALRSIFSRFGLPEQLVSDNGAHFTSEEFSHFMKANGVKHILSAPYHPSSNGLAERFVQTFKRAMRAGERDGKSLTHQLAEFLFSYRSSNHTTTNLSPSELFFTAQTTYSF